jgi:hypothetical protein
VLIDGRPLATYVRAYVAGGRVFAPLSPVLTRVADRLWFEGNELVVERGERRVRIRLASVPGDRLNGSYVAVGPVLRALGASVRYDSGSRRLSVRLSPHATVVSPAPFDATLPSVAPNAVFTPAVPSTPRPIWTGSPLPRRTPLAAPPLQKHGEVLK